MNKIITDKEISIQAKFIYSIIKSNLVDGEFTMTNQEIDDMIGGKSIPSISRYISELIRAGYVELVSFDGRKRVLRIKEE